MAPEQVIDMGRLTMETLLIMSAPLMIVALVVGLIIALFQALTSIQEMTLTFVPKILLVFIAMIMVMPWMGDVLNTFSIEIFTMIATGGRTG
ncbi:MAG: flagellar biosynthetic protein FliQ [Magnetococcales bacterium]|nr:flagellar biosynthetic protein FliQ [Magnetococcales bacterium]|tara:strand:- start:247 stop:522 length:276 start_codon:yes stop_codon:yes gene_type:complete